MPEVDGWWRWWCLSVLSGVSERQSLGPLARSGCYHSLLCFCLKLMCYVCYSQRAFMVELEVIVQLPCFWNCLSDSSTCCGASIRKDVSVTPSLDCLLVKFQETICRSLFVCWYFISAGVRSALGCAAVKMGSEVLSLFLTGSCLCQKRVLESVTLLRLVLLIHSWGR